MGKSKPASFYPKIENSSSGYLNVKSQKTILVAQEILQDFKFPSVDRYLIILLGQKHRAVGTMSSKNL